jgi:hypothetical protein
VTQPPERRLPPPPSVPLYEIRFGRGSTPVSVLRAASVPPHPSALAAPLTSMPRWQASHSYVTAVPFTATEYTGHDVIAVAPYKQHAWALYGTTGATEPDWQHVDVDVNDGEMVWQHVTYSGPWQASTNQIAITAAGSVWLRASGTTTGTTEPDWSGVPYGGTISDGTITWVRSGAYAGVWSPSTTYAVGQGHFVEYLPFNFQTDWMVPTYVRQTGTGPGGGAAGWLGAAQWSRRTSATSGATEPGTWHDATERAVTYDNQVLWRRFDALAVPAPVLAVTSVADASGGQSVHMEWTQPDPEDPDKRVIDYAVGRRVGVAGSPPPYGGGWTGWSFFSLHGGGPFSIVPPQTTYDTYFGDTQGRWYAVEAAVGYAGDTSGTPYVSNLVFVEPAPYVPPPPPPPVVYTTTPHYVAEVVHRT